MKTIEKNNNTYDFVGCAKTINVNGAKMKVAYDMLNFNRNNTKFNCEYDLVILGKVIGKVSVLACGSYFLNGMEFASEKRMMEYAMSKIEK